MHNPTAAVIARSINCRARDIGVASSVKYSFSDEDWTSEFFRAAGYVQGVKSMEVVICTCDHLLGFSFDIDRAGGRINNRRAGDANLRHNIGRIYVPVRNRGHAVSRIQEIRV